MLGKWTSPKKHFFGKKIILTPFLRKLENGAFGGSIVGTILEGYGKTIFSLISPEIYSLLKRYFAHSSSNIRANKKKDGLKSSSHAEVMGFQSFDKFGPIICRVHTCERKN